MSDYDAFDQYDEDEFPPWVLNELDVEAFGMNVHNYLFDMGIDDFFDDDDYDDYDDDDEFLSDYYFSDEEADEDHNKIFVTLQDSSQILRKLRFHRSAGRFRLPKIRLGKSETYESLFHGLEDVEVMLKAWKKRTDHPFTAHIERDSLQSKNLTEEKSPQFGIDYFDHDLDHESDSDEEVEESSKPDVNDALTKKKYSQSTKNFYLVFETDKQFEIFLGRIRYMRKYIYGIIFSLFRSNLPESISRKLPAELWEKVWKYTQSQYDEEKALHVGIKGQSEGEKNLEQRRITDLFGAVGNIHMILFEILFKRPYITSLSPVAEVLTSDVCEMVENVKNNYIKYIFNWYTKLLDRQFNQLLDLDLGSPIADLSTCVPPENDMSSNIQANNKGRVTIKCHSSMPQSPDLAIFPDTMSALVAFISNESDQQFEKSDGLLTVVVWHIEKSEAVVTIKTGLRYLDTVCGINKNKPREILSLSQNQFALLSLTPSSTEHQFVLHHWQFDPQGPFKVLDSYSCQTLSGSFGESHEKSTVVYLKTTEIKNETFFVLCHAHEDSTNIFVHKANSDQELGTPLLSFPGRNFRLDGISGPRFILTDQSREFLFCDIFGKGVICNYPFLELCKDANHTIDASSMDLHCNYAVKFDQDANRNQFIIYSENCTSYQLLEYDLDEGNGEDVIPVVIASGSAQVPHLTHRNVDCTALLEGCLYSYFDHEIRLRALSGDYFNDYMETNGVTAFAFDSRDGSINPISSMISTEEGRSLESCYEGVLMNEYHRNIYFVSAFSASPKPLHFSNQNTFCIFQQNRIFPNSDTFDFLSISFHHHDASADLSFYPDLFKKDDKKRLENRYISEEKCLSGKIIKWNFSYGFIQIFNKESRKSIGNVFVHISAFQNRGNRRIILGQKVEFNLTRDKTSGKTRAINVKMLPSKHCPDIC